MTQNNPVNQSELKANTGSRREAREDVHEQSALVLVLLLIGWESGASLLNQSLSEVTQNQSKREILLALKWNPLHPAQRSTL